jgi:DNA-directed RNA polymerase specialized sigma24 family protein
MTGNIWDAEDLLQDTLLRGYGAIGRGDVTSREAHVKGPRAYLFRIAPISGSTRCAAANHYFEPRRDRRFLDRRAVDPSS